jgi:hypothetical protein
VTQRTKMLGRWKLGSRCMRVGGLSVRNMGSFNLYWRSMVGLLGHWEGDLLGGTKNSHIATLVKRHLRFTMLTEVPSKDTAKRFGPIGVAAVFELHEIIRK